MNAAGITYAVYDRNQLTSVGVVSYGYDANGNLRTETGGDNRSYTYDDENRLIMVPWGGSSYRTEFAYDALSRLRKRTEKFLSGGVWTLIGETRYLYDGMQVVHERDGSNVPLVAYTRGKDLSGSLQGAGGIDGMLARSHGYSAGSWSTHSYYHADGRGNITRLVNSTNGVVGSYKYDAYGRTISSSGALASANVYRFSSKMWIYDGTPGYYYFGYRFYQPSLQRWLNRDPLGEWADINLHRFSYHSPAEYVDPDGLWGVQFGENGRNWGFGDPTLVFDNETWNDFGEAAQATLDGIIPPLLESQVWSLGPQCVSCARTGDFVRQELSYRAIRQPFQTQV